MPGVEERIARDCLAVRLRLLNRAVTRIYDEALRPLGLKVSQMNILVVVGLRGPIRPVDVGSLLSLEKSTLSRNVQRIVDQGWIEVRDGLRLTRKGSRLLARAEPAWKQAQERAHALLGAKGAAAVKGAAERLWKR